MKLEFTEKMILVAFAVLVAILLYSTLAPRLQGFVKGTAKVIEKSGAQEVLIAKRR